MHTEKLWTNGQGQGTSLARSLLSGTIESTLCDGRKGKPCGKRCREASGELIGYVLVKGGGVEGGEKSQEQPLLSNEISNSISRKGILIAKGRGGVFGVSEDNLGWGGGGK